MHKKVGLGYFLLTFGKARDVNGSLAFIEQLLDFVDFALNLDQEHQVLNYIEDDLFENHDYDKVILQLLEALMIEYEHKEADIGVDELEHVELVNQ